MKKIFTISLFLLIAIHLFSQNPSSEEFSLLNIENNLFVKPIIHEGVGTIENGSRSSKNISEKSAQLKKLRLDSIVGITLNRNTDTFENDYKKVFTYDINGNNTMYTLYTWDDLSSWIGSRKFEYAYDSKGKFAGQAEYFWNESIQGWIGVSKSGYTFDTDDNVIVQMEYTWIYETKDWHDKTKYEFTYDSNGNMTTQTESNWNFPYNKWDASRKYEYTHDSLDNKTLEVEYNWDLSKNDWGLYDKLEYTYDSVGNKTSFKSYTWDEYINDWYGGLTDDYSYNSNGEIETHTYYSRDFQTDSLVALLQERFSYDTNGNVAIYATYNWNTQNNNWINSSKYETTYDSIGNITLGIVYNWDNQINDWVYHEKRDFLYDSMGNRTAQLTYNWDTQTNSWIIVGNKQEYLFDSNGNVIGNSLYAWDIMTANWIGLYKSETMYNYQFENNDIFYPNSLIVFSINPADQTNGYQWNASEGDWKYTSHSTYYYSEHDYTRINQVNLNQSLSVYPNPTSDFIFIESNIKTGDISFHLFDLNGSTVLSQNLSQSDKVPVQSIKSGTYIYRLESNYQVQNGKIIIQH